MRVVDYAKAFAPAFSKLRKIYRAAGRSNCWSQLELEGFIVSPLLGCCA